MERKELYKIIDSEINYQELKEGHIKTTISDYLIKIEHHLNESKTAKYYLYNDECLDRIRKIGALAILCLEEYGCPERRVDPEKSIKSF